MLYFDESGYTGADLMNANHPYFTLASVCISDEEVERVKIDIGYSEWGRELHFTNMYTNPQGRNVLDKLFAHPLMDSRHIKLAFAEKRYCIYAQIVDILVETFFYEHGENLYGGANNLILANSLYYAAIAHPNQSLVLQFESSFVNMARKPSVESIAEFYKVVDLLFADSVSNELLKETLSYIPPTIETIFDALRIQTFHMDLTVPLFVDSIQCWYRDTNKKHNVIFDSSEPFFANLDYLKSIRDMDVKETETGYGIKKHIFPFPVGSMEIAKSHEYFGIQVADVFAGALNSILTARKNKFSQYINKIKSYPLFEKIEINIAPSSLEFIEERMNDVNGTNAVDFICEHVKS